MKNIYNNCKKQNLKYVACTYNTYTKSLMTSRNSFSPYEDEKANSVCSNFISEKCNNNSMNNYYKINNILLNSSECNCSNYKRPFKDFNYQEGNSKSKNPFLNNASYLPKKNFISLSTYSKNKNPKVIKFNNVVNPIKMKLEKINNKTNYLFINQKLKYKINNDKSDLSNNIIINDSSNNSSIQTKENFMIIKSIIKNHIFKKKFFLKKLNKINIDKH
jgi:hypothetical protein